jgi:hypothetical protein
MVYMQYVAEKKAWLAQNPEVSPSIEAYRIARGWPVWEEDILEDHRKFLGFNRREPSGKLISTSMRMDWTSEEIIAYIDFMDHEDVVLERRLQQVNDAGYVIPEWREWDAATEEDQRALAQRYTL